MKIMQAGPEDVSGILSLLKANHINFIDPRDKVDGFVTTNMTEAQLAALIVKENGVTIAKENGKVFGFALAASWEFWKEWPFFAYMIEKLPEYSFDGHVLTTENSYQYGPVCIDKSMRGTGLFEQVFYASLKSMEARFPIMATFINQINGRSYAAHTQKVSMTTAGTFDYNNNHYYLMACPTSLRESK